MASNSNLQVSSFDLGQDAIQIGNAVPLSDLVSGLYDTVVSSQQSSQSTAASIGGAVTTAADYALMGLSWRSSTITWSIATANYPEDVSAGVTFTHSLGPTAEALLQQAFARWAEVSGLNFVEVPDSASLRTSADIRIGWANLPSPSPGLQVMGITSWSSTSGSSFQPDVKIGLEDPTFVPLYQAPGYPIFYGPSYVTLTQIMLHEIGHAIGISHATAPTDLMYPLASTANPDFSGTDVAAVQANYPASAAGVDPPPTFAITDTTLGTSLTAIGSNYRGPVAYLQDQYVYAGMDKINVTSWLPNVFIHGGGGDDALAARSGQNVLDGGIGSNFLVGGTGTDTFFVDDRTATADIWSTVVGFHAGDAATVWGVTPQDFQLSWVDNQGAGGFTGLTLHASAAGKATASLTLAGYNQPDLSNGRLSVLFGTDPASGSSYMYVHGNG